MVIVLIAMAAMGLLTGIASIRSFKKSTVESLIYFTLSAFFLLNGVPKAVLETE